METYSKQKVVVVGAGLAGLTIAYRLHQYGKEVEIYEARPRVGGRVHTVQIQNLDGTFSNAELGAQNITDGGEATNILSLVKELNLEVIDTYIPFKGIFYDGETFHDRKLLISEILSANENIDSVIEQLAQSSASMQDLLNQLELTSAQKSFLTFIMNAFDGLPPSLLSTDPHNISLLKYILSGGLSSVHAISDSNPLIHRMSILEGNAILPERLAEILGNKIHLNKVLTEIKYETDHEIELTFSDGKKVSCNILILAIPCSVFKNIEFNDVIDKKRLEIIRSMHYGTTTKILMPFKQNDHPGHWISTHTMGTFFNDDQKLLNLYFVNDDGKNIFDELLLPLKRHALRLAVAIDHKFYRLNF